MLCVQCRVRLRPAPQRPVLPIRPSAEHPAGLPLVHVRTPCRAVRNPTRSHYPVARLRAGPPGWCRRGPRQLQRAGLRWIFRRSCNFDRDDATGEIFTLEIAPVAHQEQCAAEAHAESEVLWFCQQNLNDTSQKVPDLTIAAYHSAFTAHSALESRPGVSIRIFLLAYPPHRPPQCAADSGALLSGRHPRARLAVVLPRKLCFGRARRAVAGA